MSGPFKLPDAEAVARARLLAERPLSREEFMVRLSTPMGPDEFEEIRSLIEWFTRRYSTPGERLAYARRAYRRWTRPLQTDQRAGMPREE